MNTTEKSLTQMTVEIPSELHKRAKLFALKSDTNLRAVVIAALTAYLEGKEK